MKARTPDTSPVAPTTAPDHCTCVRCEIVYRLRKLPADRARALAEWIANDSEADGPVRAHVREILGL